MNCGIQPDVYVADMADMFVLAEIMMVATMMMMMVMVVVVMKMKMIMTIIMLYNPGWDNMCPNPKKWLISAF